MENFSFASKNRKKNSNSFIRISELNNENDLLRNSQKESDLVCLKIGSNSSQWKVKSLKEDISNLLHLMVLKKTKT